MDRPAYFDFLMHIVLRPAMYGIQDVRDLECMLFGYTYGGRAPELDRLLGDLTAFTKREWPEFAEYNCGWSHIVKAHSWERGGSITLFILLLGKMLLEQGHWTHEQFATFTSSEKARTDAWQALPALVYT